MFFTNQLLAWFRAHQADLPWRQDRSPYRVWLSEIMLQQTQVGTVVEYYRRFLERFPTVQALAESSLDDVLKMWEGLGYYSRARNLHRTARKVTAENNGQFPGTVEELIDLPGIGRYTAGAIASIAFGLDAAVLDGNVIRILTRLYDISADVSQHGTRQRLWALAESLVPPGEAGDFNEALMELGRVICKPRAPLCQECPVRDHCQAFAAGTQVERPVKRPRSPTPHYDVAAGVVYEQGEQATRMLIAQRPAEGLLGGLWEFPGGKQEDGESLPQALARELREELGITVDVGDFLVQVKHAFTHFRITLHAFECRHTGGEPAALGVADFAWVTLADMDRYAFGKADQAIIAELRERPHRLL